MSINQLLSTPATPNTCYQNWESTILYKHTFGRSYPPDVLSVLPGLASPTLVRQLRHVSGRVLVDPNRRCGLCVAALIEPRPSRTKLKRRPNKIHNNSVTHGKKKTAYTVKSHGQVQNTSKNQQIHGKFIQNSKTAQINNPKHNSKHKIDSQYQQFSRLSKPPISNEHTLIFRPK